MSKFNIRQPFSVHLEVINDVTKPDGSKVRQRTQQSFFPGQPIELTDEQAVQHLHKLEPADPAAEKFMKAFHARQDAARADRAAEEGPSIDERIAAGIEAALAKRDAAGKK